MRAALKTKAPGLTLISCQVAKLGQDAQMIEVVALPAGDRLRIDIRSDSYASQCHARVERWDGAKWQGVAFRLHPNMQTPVSLAYRPAAPSFFDFRADRDWLIAEASKIIGGQA